MHVKAVTLAKCCDCLPQKIFVMPNMDDVYLPIMHSAMDLRSNANLLTVTNDALKDPEPEECDFSDMWRLKGLWKKKKRKEKNKGGIVNTMAVWHDTRAPKAKGHLWVHQSVGPTLQHLYPCTRHIVAPKCSQRSWKCCMSLWPSVATGKETVTHKTSQTVFFFLLSKTKLAFKKWDMLKWISACGRPTAIRFNPKTHDTCDVQLQQNVSATILWNRAFQLVVCERTLWLLIMKLQAVVGNSEENYLHNGTFTYVNIHLLYIRDIPFSASATICK